MNKRQGDLLKRLIIQEDYLPIRYFSNIFNVSGKTLSKDLDVIEEVINSIEVKIDRKQGIGIKLYYTPSQLEKLNIILNNISINAGDNSLQDRRIQILLNLLINTNEYTTIQKLSDEYMVSRTSINNDLNEIQQKLDIYNLELSKTLKGTRIVGSEINIRKALVFTIQEYVKVNPNYITKYQNIRHRELSTNGISTILNEESICFFENLLNGLENKLRLVIYEPYYTNLLTHLVITTNRIIDGNYIENKIILNDILLLKNKELYDSAIYLIREIEKEFNIKINEEEVVYIYKYLTSIGLSYDEDKNDIEDLDLPSVYFTKELIDIISEMTNKNYRLSVSLFDRLLLHIKPMLNRKKYNIQIKNSLLNEFLKEFEEEFIIVKIACFVVCKKLEINMISNHEVAYILSYFLSEDEKASRIIKIKAVVICHSGYGTSQLLATRLEKEFNNIEVVDIIASNSINNISLKEIDLIISTVDLNIEYPYLMVSAFLNKIDKKNIKNNIEIILENKRKFSSQNKLEAISIEIIDNDKDIKQFKRSFNEKNLIYIKDNIYIYIMPSIENLVKKYLIEENKIMKHIFVINYSNFMYLAKCLRQIIRD